MEVGGIVADESLLDLMPIAEGVRLVEGLHYFILGIEEAEVFLIEGVDGGVDVAVEDVIALKLEVLLHGLQIFGDIRPILIKHFQGLTRAIVNFIVEIVPMLTEIHEAIEPILRKRDIDLVIDLG